MNCKLFGQFLYQRRVGLHLSQSFVADKLGYSKQIVSNWERGLSYPNMTCWDNLLELLKLDINGFINCKNECKIQGHSFNEDKFIFHLKDLRLNAKLTQIELASKIGTNHKTISSWENGTSFPSLETFIQLSKVLKVSYPELFYGEKVEVIQLTNESKRNKLSIKRRILIYAPILATSIAILIPIINKVVSSNQKVIVKQETTVIDNTDVENTPSGGNTDIDDTPSGGNTDVVVDPPSSSNEDDPIVVPPFTDYSFQITTPKPLELHKGDTFTLQTVTNPSNYEVSWISNKENIVSIDSNGVLECKHQGSALITGYLKGHADYYDTIEIQVINKGFDNVQSFAPVSKSLYDSIKWTEDILKVRYYFEDKKTILYEQDYHKGDTFNCVENIPEFGPYLGYKYNFLGWDINQDGVVDALPDKVTSNMSLYAVYSKDHTAETDFIWLQGKEYYLDKDISTVIIPSEEYTNSITPSPLYNSYRNPERSPGNLLNSSELIFMEGCKTIKNHLSDNLRYISFPSTMTNFSSDCGLPEIYVRGGYFHGNVAASLSVTNEYIVFDISGIDRSVLVGSYTLYQCNNLKYVGVYSDGTGYCPTIRENAFYECPNLEMLDLYNLSSYQGSSYDGYLYNDFMKETGVSYVDLRGFQQTYLTEPIISNTTDTINIVIPNLVSTNNFFDENHEYNVFVGFGKVAISSKTNLVPDKFKNLTNVTYYYYSETKGENTWHFNANGYPSNIY